jgi:hypothetical protein
MVCKDEKLNIRAVIKSLADYVIINSVATDSTSFFYGRAGMSLCLFETARFLKDDFIEDYAFALLKQSLLNEKDNIRFDTGLSGIGYAFNYLIRNKFIDSNFIDIFQKQHDIIVRRFLNQSFTNMELGDLLQQWQLRPYFYYASDKRADARFLELNEICAMKLRISWESICKDNSSLNKEAYIILWRKYLKILSFMDNISNNLYINEYLCLLQKGLLKRELQSLHCISIIALKNPNPTFIDCAYSSENKYDLLDFYPIDSLRMETIFSEPYISNNLMQNIIRKWFCNKTVVDIEELLSYKMSYSGASASLSLGLSRLILGLIYLEMPSKRIVNEIFSVI